MLKKFRDLDPIVHIILALAIVVLFSQNLKLNKIISNITSSIKIPPQTEEEGASSVSEDKQVEAGVTLEEIDDKIAEALSLITPLPKTTTTASTGTRGGTDYVNLGNIGSTTNTDWVDVGGAEVQFDLIEDYGESAVVAWEASLKVAHENGQAFARIYDATNKIVVLGSELSTINNADFQRKSSGNLNLWRGRNVYRVQIKSLNSMEVTYSGGTMRVSY